MIRAPELAVSQPMYAFNPDTWAVTGQLPWKVHTVNAVWFRRRRGIIVATVGTYQPMVLNRDNRPAGETYAEWIAAADDNRYGGNWFAAGDGSNIWFAEARTTPRDLKDQADTLINAAFGAYPDPPPGYDGWWTFPRGHRA